MMSRVCSISVLPRWPNALAFGFFSCLICVQASSQVNQVGRYEREHKGSADPWMVIPMKEEGLALVQDTDKFRDGLKIFKVVLLDTALAERGVVDVELQHRWRLIGYDFGGGTVYLLFRSGETDAGDLQLVSIPLESRQSTKYEIKHEFTFRLTHFSVVKRNVVLGGYVSREPAVLLFVPDTGQLKVVPGFFTSDTELLDLRVNENQTFNTLVVNRSSREKKTLLLRTFDDTGLQLLEDHVEIDMNKTILSGLTSSLVRDELLIAGTYTISNSKQAAGFFCVLADPFKEQPIYYYDFGQLNHFYDYLNPKRADKIKASSKRAREHGRDPDFRSNVANIRLEERPDGFFLLAETYNMTTGTAPYTYQGPYSPYYSPYGFYPYSPFMNRYYNSPYNYFNQPQNSDVNVLQSEVIVFTPDGKLDWDHSLKLKEGRRPALEQTSDFWCDRNKIAIVTKKESELMVKARYKNNESSGDTLRILTRNETEIVRSESDDEGGVRFWYGDKLYVWGYQTIKDPNLPLEDRVRSVFYVVKVDAN